MDSMDSTNATKIDEASLDMEASEQLQPDITNTQNTQSTSEEDYTPHPSPQQISECKLETIEHIEQVRKYIKVCTDKLTTRGIEHDRSKLSSPELEYFAEVNHTLDGLTYGGEEYMKNLSKLGPALEHHYNRNTHHPEHYANGVKDMTLIDVIEMLCDWKASSLRQNNGNLLKNIDINTQRFKIDKQLKQLIINTAKLFEEV